MFGSLKEKLLFGAVSATVAFGPMLAKAADLDASTTQAITTGVQDAVSNGQDIIAAIAGYILIGAVALGALAYAVKWIRRLLGR